VLEQQTAELNSLRAVNVAEAVVEVDAVRNALAGMRIEAPSCFEVFMDLSNHHLHNPAVIRRITLDMRIVPTLMSDGLITPEPWSP